MAMGFISTDASIYINDFLGVVRSKMAESRRYSDSMSYARKNTIQVCTRACFLNGHARSHAHSLVYLTLSLSNNLLVAV